ncbi:MAG: hypothetical protein LAO31_14395 [Acidobacteriia bacterium]|nr:hypothetical protein [Terriglobia bacterium]
MLIENHELVLFNLASPTGLTWKCQKTPMLLDGINQAALIAKTGAQLRFGVRREHILENFPVRLRYLADKVSHKKPAVSYQLSAFSSQLSAFSSQLSAFSSQLSALSFQLSAFSHQLSAFSHQLQANNHKVSGFNLQ